MQIKKIEALSNTYPEHIEGTTEWFSCAECVKAFCDLYEAEEIVKAGHVFSGMNQKLVHYPDGKVYVPFDLKENVYVEAPLWYDAKFYFLSVDFHDQKIHIDAYEPLKDEKTAIVSLPLSEVTDCYNLRLSFAPLMLGRDANEGFYEIIWPMKKRVPLGEGESAMFLDGDILYCSEWVEDPEYHEYVVQRNIHTGERIDRQSGALCRMQDDVYWMV